jgi:hypothetical protein
MAELKKEIANAVEDYLKAWEIFVDVHNLRDFVSQPTAIGWKVADLKEFMKALEQLLASNTEQVHIGRVNDRYIASIVFQTSVAAGVKVIKLMQRRASSSDLLGLDHLDFTVGNLTAAKTELKSAQVPFETQSNDAHEWLSLRFGEGQSREAKFVDHSVLDVCIAELQDAAKSL